MNSEKKIINLFLFHEKLKFNEIEKLSNLRSNAISYHLNKLVKRNILSKDEGIYRLSEEYESRLHFIEEYKVPLPVILIHIGSSNNAFLIVRNKRPFKGKLSLPGGRLLLGENIFEGARRIMKEKFKMRIYSAKIKAVVLEHLKKKEKIIHSAILFILSAETKDNVDLINVNKNKSKIISSDFKFIKQNTKNIEIPVIETKI